MIKCYIKTFEEFVNCVNADIPIYIEEKIKNFPIPSLYGIILEIISDDLVVIAKDKNIHMNDDDFKNMLININIREDAQVTKHMYKEILNIYTAYQTDKYSLFVVDNTFSIKND